MTAPAGVTTASTGKPSRNFTLALSKQSHAARVDLGEEGVESQAETADAGRGATPVAERASYRCDNSVNEAQR